MSKRAHNFIDRAGQRFGRLTVLHVDEEKTQKKKVQWVCRCDCGTVKSISSFNLGSHKTKRTVSCGCYMREQQRKPRKARPRQSPKERGITEVIRTYKKRAEKNGWPYALTREEFKSFIFDRCYYCGTSESNYFSVTKVKRSHRYTWRLSYMGIDRIDSEKGYTVTNCRTCCIKCNKMKLNHTSDEFKEHVQRVYTHWASK